MRMAASWTSFQTDSNLVPYKLKPRMTEKMGEACITSSSHRQTWTIQHQPLVNLNDWGWEGWLVVCLEEQGIQEHLTAWRQFEALSVSWPEGVSGL